MKLRQATTCANCERLAKPVAKLEARVLTLVSRLPDASTRIAELEKAPGARSADSGASASGR